MQLKYFAFLTIFLPRSVVAQDLFTGTWKYTLDSIEVTLKVAAPERNTLYPARLEIRSAYQSAAFDMLLAKKNSRQLGISKNKIAIDSLRFPSQLLSGYLNYTKDAKGAPLLYNTRIASLMTMMGKQTIPALFGALFIDEIVFRKSDTIPWPCEHRQQILNPSFSPIYLGLHNSIHTKSPHVTLNVSGTKKKNDIVSVSLNGQGLIENIYLNKTGYLDEIRIDSGLNVLMLFAENFGNKSPSKGKVNFAIEDKQYALDFSNSADSAATFIAVKVYDDAEVSTENTFMNNPVPSKQELKKNEKLSGDIISNSAQLTFGIWDDAVEDGDTISINIDGRWITRGFPVKKQPQFLTVTLQPGPNTISFIGENLGSIPPNTSVLEIIDGKKRKSFFMQSNVGEANLIRIYYEVK